MKNILILNQKGGTGKSQISVEVARSLQRTHTPSALVNLDAQGAIIDPYKDDGAEIMVIDTAGQLKEKLATYVKNSDVLIVPCRSSRQDTQPLFRTLKIIQENRKPNSSLFIVLNCYHSRYKSSNDFLQSLYQIKIEAEIMTLPESQLFVQASAMRKSILDYRPKSEPAKATLLLVNNVRKAAGLSAEVI